MSPYRRNVMVGAVVLCGLIILAWMLIQFGARFVSPFAPPYMRVRFVADRANGISNGSAVLYRGVNVGRVESVTRDPDALHVAIDTMLDRDPPLPGNLKAVIRTQSAVSGGGAIVLELADAQPQGSLQEGQTVNTEYVGLDIIPDEFTALARELTAAARQFRESNIVGHADEQVAKLGKLAESLQAVIGDPQLRENLNAALANFRATTEKANNIAGNLEKVSADLPKLTANTADAISKTRDEVLALSRQVGDRIQQIARVLDSIQSIAAKVDKGEGTAGALVNDPRLYQALVDSTLQLNATITDLKRLIDQWEQEGISLRAK